MNKRAIPYGSLPYFGTAFCLQESRIFTSVRTGRIARQTRMTHACFSGMQSQHGRHRMHARQSIETYTDVVCLFSPTCSEKHVALSAEFMTCMQANSELRVCVCLQLLDGVGYDQDLFSTGFFLCEQIALVSLAHIGSCQHMHSNSACRMPSGSRHHFRSHVVSSHTSTLSALH